MADYTPVPCPQCGSKQIQKVSYTLWGGMIGPRLLNHVKCLDCKTTFNGKTGKSNARAIGIYLLVTFVIVFFIFYLVASTRG
jgi:transposase-like protein